MSRVRGKKNEKRESSMRMSFCYFLWTMSLLCQRSRQSNKYLFLAALLLLEDWIRISLMPVSISLELPVKYLIDKILVWLLINAKQILYWRWLKAINLINWKKSQTFRKIVWNSMTNDVLHMVCLGTHP